MIPALTLLLLAGWVIWLKKQLDQAHKTNDYLRRRLHMCRSALARAAA